MPPWPGGECPDCTDYMPANLIHCQSCRALLNADLDPNQIEIPEFMPLQEIDPETQSNAEVIALRPFGFFIKCVQCEKELKINRRFLGEQVQCKGCETQFRFSLNAIDVTWLGVYADCPHCQARIRAARRYLGTTVACNFCSGCIQLLDEEL